jgi:hypothetical protein
MSGHRERARAGVARTSVIALDRLAKGSDASLDHEGYLAADDRGTVECALSYDHGWDHPHPGEDRHAGPDDDGSGLPGD